LIEKELPLILRNLKNILKKILVFKNKSIIQTSSSDNEFYSTFKKILEDINQTNTGKKLNETD
jgi:hypothetical protein